MYNAFFTSWQCLFAYMLERDINEEYILRYPQVYKAGQMGKYFSYGTFWKWIVQAAYHGAMTFYFVMNGRTEASRDSTGQTNSHWNNSTLIFSLIIHLVCLKLFGETKNWNMVSIIAAFFSILVYYVVLVLGSINSIAVIFTSELSGTITTLVTSSYFWILVVCHPIMCLLPDITYNMMQ
jgi:magnesium-transporting ATPase (P-type)